MAWVGQITLKKNLKNLFTIFFILYQKIPLVSSLENSPYFIFFPKDDRAMIIYNFLLLRPCTLFVLQTSQNRFGFFIRLVSSFWFWHRQYYLPWPYRIYYASLYIPALFWPISKQSQFSSLQKQFLVPLKNDLFFICKFPNWISCVFLFLITINLFWHTKLFK